MSWSAGRGGSGLRVYRRLSVECSTNVRVLPARGVRAAFFFKRVGRAHYTFPRRVSTKNVYGIDKVGRGEWRARNVRAGGRAARARLRVAVSANGSPHAVRRPRLHCARVRLVLLSRA